ncbi:unnamed protein product [Acanthoscelides obtectus]|uniref:DDE Tnp4 domain-containing protein n=1 Tax=Acanthoscelides obtectus TaxID=200917 RepID=A0A9P0LQK1_ACAOB|nr:unnamed protein product [Acanthoscelides obtectus]CAK1683207.1 Protein ALP1-like [Acanthoscelides obtectus]
MSTTSSSDDDDFLTWQLSRRKRRFWVHPYNEDCTIHGNFIPSQQLKSDEDKFQLYHRMSQNTYQLLLDLVKPSLTKQNTHYRGCVPAEERLLITIRYLATGSSFRAMSYIFKRGETTIGKIVNESCEAIWKVLQPIYMKKPSTNDWLSISQEFLQRWNLPNCIGAIDGKHIRIQKPMNSGSSYFNYKEYFSIHLMACADANGSFTTVDVGDYGRNNDSGVFRNSGLGQALCNKTLNIPESVPLPGEEQFGQPFQYYFAADEGFPLSINIMRPYNGRALNNNRRIFNYRLSRGRKIVECAFGMLVSKFRVFETPISCSVQKVDKIVKAACILHNFIKNHDNIILNPTDDATNITNIPIIINQGRPNNNSTESREYLCNYFQKPYRLVPWQNKYTV